MLVAVLESVEDALTSSQVQINAVFYQNLLIHIAIALVRTEAGCYVPLDAATISGIESTDEYFVARAVARGIHDRLGIKLPDEETAYIAVHFAGKRAVCGAPAADGARGNLVISDDVWTVVDEMLELVHARFRFDFRGDLELRMNLARHLVPLSVRLRSKTMLKNPLLSDIATRYPLAWSMAVSVGEILRRTYDTLPSHDELGYIALSFALALERQRGKAPRMRLLVVCASGVGSSRLLECRCKREFGDCIESIDTCDVMRVGDVDFTNIDYVFTTVPIPFKVPVPVREVSFFFDAAEAEVLRALLRVASRRDIADHFSRELFFPHLELTSKDEVLRFLCAAAHEVHGGCEGLTSLVFEREGAAATSFGNLVAMPHPLEPVSDDTFVVIGLLDEPVTWDASESVRAVFLVCFSRAGGPELDAFISALADLLTDERSVAQLIEAQDWQTFTRLIDIQDANR